MSGSDVGPSESGVRTSESGVGPSESGVGPSESGVGPNARQGWAVGASGVVVVAAIVLSGWQWHRVFDGPGHLLASVSAAIGAGMVAHFGATRLARPVSFAVALILLLLGLTARYNSDAAALPGDLISSWKALASTGLLLPTEPRFILVPGMVAGIAAWCGIDWIHRKASAAPAVAVVIGAHVVALMYTSSQGQPPIWYGAVLTLLIGLLFNLQGFSRPGGASFDETASRGRVALPQVIGSIAVVGLLIGAAALFTTVADRAEKDEAFDLRDRLVRPVDLASSSTPLARVKAGLVTDNPGSVFTIRLDGLGPEDEVDLVTVALLDRYDGSIWTTAAQMEVAGSRLPNPAQMGPSPTLELRQTVTLSPGYPFRFLPTAGTISGTDDEVAWDASTGMTASIDLTVTEYRSTVGLQRAPAELSAVGDTPSMVAYAARPAELSDGQRSTLNGYLAEIVNPDDDPLTQLQAIEADLASPRFGYNIDAPAGHSLAAITSYLASDVDSDAPTPRIGFAEHSSAAFALLARELGVPSRVVVGYRLDQPLTRERSEQIVNEDRIHSWPEVWLADHGWVAFEPTNPSNQTADDATRAPAVSSAGADANVRNLPNLEEPVLLAPEAASGGRSSWWALLAIGLVPLLYALVVPLAKRVRRLRRRSGPSDRQVAGAWQETQDRLAELGLPVSESLSVLDVSDELARIDLTDVGDHLLPIADPLDVALYSPFSATDEQVAEVWTSSGAAISAARAASSKGDRVQALLDPRPLIRR